MNDKEIVDRLNRQLEKDVELQKCIHNQRKRPTYNGKVYNLKGLGLAVYSNEKGDMYAREMCSCGGCFDNTYKLEENDVVVSFKNLYVRDNSHLRKIKLITMSVTIGQNVILDDVKWESHKSAIDFYCGSQLYDNYGIDGSKSFTSELIKTGLVSNANNIALPNAAQQEIKKALDLFI
jgi:hypothetical protein